MPDPQAVAAAGPVQPRLFISYSRTDSAMADRLEAGMAERGFEILRDVEDIAYGEEWWARLVQMIGDADTVLFLLTPRAAASPVCGKEVAEAHRRGKRIMPLLIEPTDWDSLPTALAAINSLSLVGLDDGAWPEKLDQLRDALQTDLPWVRQHSRLGAAAETWAEGGRSPADLLAGTELRRALDWLAHVPPHAAEPTPLQREYIAASEAARHRRRVTLLASIAAASILILAAAAIALLYRLDARLGAARVALQNNDLGAAEQAMSDYAHDPIGRLFPPTRTARQLASEILDRGIISQPLPPGAPGDRDFTDMELVNGALFLLRNQANGGLRIIRCDLAFHCAASSLAPAWSGAHFRLAGTQLALMPWNDGDSPDDDHRMLELTAVATTGTPRLAGPAGPVFGLAPVSDSARDTRATSADGAFAAELGDDRVEIFDAHSLAGSPQRQMLVATIPSMPLRMRFGPDGRTLFVLSKAGLARIQVEVRGSASASPAPGGNRGPRFTPIGDGLTWRWPARTTAPADVAARLARPLPPGLLRLLGDPRTWPADGEQQPEEGGGGPASGPFAFSIPNPDPARNCIPDVEGSNVGDLVITTPALVPRLLLRCVHGSDSSLAVIAAGPDRIFIGVESMSELIEWNQASGRLLLHHVALARDAGAAAAATEEVTLPRRGTRGPIEVDLSGRTHFASSGALAGAWAAAAHRLAILDWKGVFIYDPASHRMTTMPPLPPTYAYDAKRAGLFSADGKLVLVKTPVAPGRDVIDLFDGVDGRRLALPAGTIKVRASGPQQLQVTTRRGSFCWAVPETADNQVGFLRRRLAGNKPPAC